jgi:hypothetical protein
MLEKAHQWQDEVYDYIFTHYHAELRGKKPQIIFQDKVLDSTLYTPKNYEEFPFLKDLKEREKRVYKELYGIELPETVTMILPSQKAVETAITRATNVPLLQENLMKLTKNYELFIYSKIWHEAFHDYINCLPLNHLKISKNGYSSYEVAEFIPVIYTFFGLICGYEKGLAPKSEVKDAIEAQIVSYLLPRKEIGIRYIRAMQIIFGDKFQINDLISLFNQSKIQEIKRKLEDRANEILEEFYQISTK